MQIISFIFEGIELRKCPNVKVNHGQAQLYCSRDGRFFSVTRRTIRPVKHHFPPTDRTPGRHCHNGKRGAAYPMMCNFGCRSCHSLIYETWIGPRTPGMQIDHLNGIVTDYRADNLQEVTPRENMRRAKLLRLLKQYNLPYYEQIKYDREALLRYFRRYDIVTPEQQIENELNSHLYDN